MGGRGKRERVREGEGKEWGGREGEGRGGLVPSWEI